MKYHLCALAAAGLLLAACSEKAPVGALAEADAAVAEAQQAGAAQTAPDKMLSARTELNKAHSFADDGDMDEAKLAAAQAKADANAALVSATRDRAANAENALALSAAENAQLRDKLNARQTSEGTVVSLGDVFFGTDRAQLTPEGMQRVAEIARYLRGNPGQAVMVEGHTDATGDSAYNQKLSEARAQAVVDALIAQGIATPRVVYSGLGESAPVASNDTALGRQMNRRVDVIFVDRG